MRPKGDLARGATAPSRLCLVLPCMCCCRSRERIAVDNAVACGQLDTVGARTDNVQAKDAGPRLALSRVQLGEMTATERSRWAEQARLDAVLGCCRLSMKSWKSGVRCYVSFINTSHIQLLNPFPGCAVLLFRSSEAPHRHVLSTCARRSPCVVNSLQVQRDLR